MQNNGKTRRNEAYREQVDGHKRILNQHQPVEMSVEDMHEWARKQREEA